MPSVPRSTVSAYYNTCVERQRNSICLILTREFLESEDSYILLTFRNEAAGYDVVEIKSLDGKGVG